MTAGSAPALIVLPTAELDPERFARINAFVEAAFARPFAEIWANIGPGTHVVAEVAGAPVGHAMVVERELEVGEQRLRCGYVENVATSPALHGRGIGSMVMGRIGQIIEASFEIGALATSSNRFYERLGWETWRGPAYARRGSELIRTENHDGDVMVLRVTGTPRMRGDEPISVAWRRGELW